MWQAQLDRLPTRARIAAWGVASLDTCCVCSSYVETRDHLFLRCDFSEQIWLLITKRLGYKPFLFHTWTAFVEWLRLKDTTRGLSVGLDHTQMGMSKWAFFFWVQNTHTHI